MISASSLSTSCTGEHCVTCSDEAVAMTVLRVDRARELALCEDEGASHRTVETALVAPIDVGERVLVHAGVAIAALDEDGDRQVAAVHGDHARERRVRA